MPDNDPNVKDILLRSWYNNERETSMSKKTVKIDKATVVKGRLIKVENTKRPGFSNADKEYVAVQVEDANGKNERCLLFTTEQIAAAEKRASRNPEDLTKKGFIVNILD
jgi:hypothetical protein